MTLNRLDRTQTAQIGEAGVHFVASELYQRGMVALPTSRNTAGIDMVVVKRDGKRVRFCALEVKTTLSLSPQGFWPISSKRKAIVDGDFYYVFVRRRRESPEHLEAFIVSSTQVNRERAGARGKWSGSWYLPKIAAKVEALRDWDNLWKAR